MEVFFIFYRKYVALQLFITTYGKQSFDALIFTSIKGWKF